MRITRIQVPQFRVLRDVDIEFNQEFSPQVFPLGSQNGGGKSTLLQLAFVLLHGFRKPKRIPFIVQLLEDVFFFHDSCSNIEGCICEIDLEHSEKSFSLRFEIYDGLPDAIEIDSKGEDYPSFEALERLRVLEERLHELKQEKILIERFRDDCLKLVPQLSVMSKKREQERFLWDRLRDLNEADISLSESVYDLIESIARKVPNEDAVSELLNQYALDLRNQHTRIDHQFRAVRQTAEVASCWLDEQKAFHVCDIPFSGGPSGISLLCRVSNLESFSLLDEIAEHIYLAAPATQMFSFLDWDAKNSVFSKQSDMSDYYKSLSLCKNTLVGLFTYDFLAVELLINVFRQARDRDFQSAVNSQGTYGDEYQKVVSEMNSLLQGKRVRVNADLSAISFEGVGEQEGVRLSPADLSHGELKRLSIYVWLKHKVKPDSVVLMDEVEIALHPDWQYQVTTDLVEWEPSNQYILATHSYELCEALTPAHVKELEPKLKQKESTAA